MHVAEPSWRQPIGLTPRRRRRGIVVYGAFSGLRSKHWGLKSALEYLIGQKLLAFAYWAQTQPDYAAELPLFVQEIPQIFTGAELVGYVPS